MTGQGNAGAGLAVTGDTTARDRRRARRRERAALRQAQHRAALLLTVAAAMGGATFTAGELLAFRRDDPALDHALTLAGIRTVPQLGCMLRAAIGRGVVRVTKDRAGVIYAMG